MGSLEEARQSRANDAAVLNAPDIVFVIAGREHRMRHPSRRDNRQMFGDVCEIQTLCSKPEKRVSAVTRIIDLLEQYVPAFAERADDVFDRVRVESQNGETKTTIEVVSAFAAIAKVICPPFAETATKTEIPTPKPDSTNG